MALATMTRCTLVFLILAATIGTNLEDNVISRLGLATNYAYVLGTALVGTALIAGRNAFIIASIVVFSLNANMPADFSLNFGMDRDYYTGLMMAFVCQPFFVRVVG